MIRLFLIGRPGKCCHYIMYSYHKVRGLKTRFRSECQKAETERGAADGGKSRAGQVAWWHCTVLPDLGIRVPQWWTLGK